jgi:hypothetical protein
MEQKETPPNPGFQPVEIPEDLSAVYSNLVRISHSPSDIVFDFGQMLPGQKAQVKIRVVMTPIGAKSFLRALTENLAVTKQPMEKSHMPGDTSLGHDLFKQVKTS